MLSILAFQKQKVQNYDSLRELVPKCQVLCTFYVCGKLLPFETSSGLTHLAPDLIKIINFSYP